MLEFFQGHVKKLLYYTECPYTNGYTHIMPILTYCERIGNYYGDLTTTRRKLNGIVHNNTEGTIP